MVRNVLREELQSLTVEANEAGLDPFEAYESLVRNIGKHGLWFDTYCSSSITSGGHSRDMSLDMASIIRRNTDSAHDLADELFDVGQLDPSATIEAVAVGKINHWTQSDYMTFWLGVMSRLPISGPGASRRIDIFRKQLDALLVERDVDMTVYNDSTIRPENRVVQYVKHADVFADIAQRHDSDPIRRLVRLIDTDMSLGAQTENYFARVMGTKVLRVGVAHIGGSTITESVRSTRLVADIDKIVEFGGHVFDTERRSQLVLVKQDAE